MKHNKNNGSNVPNLRFPGFTGEWKRTTLNNECEINPTTPPLPNLFVYVDLEAVVKGELIKREVIEKHIAPSRAQRVLRDGDILFQCVRPYQLNNYLYLKQDEQNWVASTGYAQLRTEHIGRFIYQYLYSPRLNKDVMLRCTGTSYPAISSSDLGKIDIYICRKEEQQKIASLLSLIDDRISTQNKIIEKLESSIKGLNNHLHETYGEEVEICLANIGITYSGLSGKTSEDFGSGKSYITYLNVYQNDIIDTSLTGNVNIMDGELQNKVAYGDVLFTLSSETPREVGVSAVCLCELHDTYLNSFCFGYRLHNRDVLIPEYMPYCFSSSKFRKFILPFAQGSTRYNLQKTDFMNSSFSVPKLSKQKHIANLLYAISQKIWTEKRMLFVCQKQKEYFLKNMFI